jgi:hypothetical protein
MRETGLRPGFYEEGGTINELKKSTLYSLQHPTYKTRLAREMFGKTDLTEEQNILLNTEYNKSLNSVKNVPIELTEELGGYWDPFEKRIKGHISSIPHELTHAAERSMSDLDKNESEYDARNDLGFRKELLKNKNFKNSNINLMRGYTQKPNEIKARINELRINAAENYGYDYNNGFNIKDYKKYYKKDPVLKHQYKDLKKYFNDKQINDLSNYVAYNKNEINLPVAFNGGVVKSTVNTLEGGTIQENNNMEYGKGGYTVKRSSDRKGKTHVVIGPDGTKKYFGDPNLGERGKSKYGKEAFYARHKKNLDANPYFRAYARATWEDGGMIPEQGHITMNKKRSLFTYGGLTVTDLNKYELGGINLGDAAKIKPVSATTAKIPSSSGGAAAPTPSPTGATVSGNAIGAGIGFGAEMIGGLIPEKQYADDEGADLGSVKSIGESTLEYGAKGAAVTAMLGGADFGIATALGAGYGAVKGWMDKEEMEEKQKEANFKNSQKRLAKRMNVAENWGNSNINTSQEMQFAQGGMVLDYNDPNANAELELQETFQMPNGQVGMVDGPSHENGGIAVNLPEGTRIWSDKLRYGGKTFAKHTKPITSKIARLEKEIAKNPNNSEAKQNSVMLLNQQLDHYFDVQETNKEANEMKRTFKNGGMIKRADGSYSRPGLWDNIRANKGSGKKPTPEMLEQERKINNEMAMGGYMYGNGGTNNPGFNALPEEVQQNILANMGMGGMLTKYQDGDMVGNIKPRTDNFAFKFNNRTDLEPIQPAQITMQPNERATGSYGEFVTPQVPNPYANKPFNQLPIGVTRPNTKLNIGEFGANANRYIGPRYIAPENLTMGDIGEATSNQPEAPGFFNKAGQFIQNNPGLIGQLGTAAITAGAQMNRVNKLARPRTLGDVRLTDKVINPNLVDYSAERQAYNRMGLNAMDEAQRGFGSSAAAQAFKNKARLNTLEGTGKSYQSQENTNAQIRNAANMARQEAGMKEAMMNNEIDKYNLENVYGYDTMTTAQKNAITAMLGNTAGQTFGKQSDYKNQLAQANIMANMSDRTVLRDTIRGNKELADAMLKAGKIDQNMYNDALGIKAYGGMMKRSFRNGGTNNPGFNALPEAVQENILNNMGMGGYMYSLGGRLMNEPMYGEGGIHIKPENRGKFTAYAKSHGKGVQEMASHIMANKEDYSPKIVKRANFAKNAKKFKH